MQANSELNNPLSAHNLKAAIQVNNTKLISQLLAAAIVEKNLGAIKLLLDNKAQLDCEIDKNDPYMNTALDFLVAVNDENVNGIIQPYCSEPILRLWEDKYSQHEARKAVAKQQNAAPAPEADTPFDEMLERSSMLHIAVVTGNLEAIDTLIADGHDKEAVDEEARTALVYAIFIGRSNVAAHLISHKVNVNTQDSSLNTPLHYACYKNDVATARLLIQAKALQDIANKDGTTPRQLAEAKGDAQILSLFSSNNASTKPARLSESGFVNSITARPNTTSPAAQPQRSRCCVIL